MRARQMREASYRKEQFSRRNDVHVAPINQLVDKLRKNPDRGTVPYVSSACKGAAARVLVVLRSPGRISAEPHGSGFVSLENDDESAARLLGFVTEAKIDPREVVPWNVYPWVIDGGLKAGDIAEGIGPLREVRTRDEIT